VTAPLEGLLVVLADAAGDDLVLQPVEPQGEEVAERTLLPFGGAQALAGTPVDGLELV